MGFRGFVIKNGNDKKIIKLATILIANPVVKSN